MTANNPFKRYWADKTSSMNRRSSSAYYQEKAREHLALMADGSLSGGVVDYGCGAGELLSQMLPGLPQRIVAVDYSNQLLETAKLKLSSSRVRFVIADALDYADRATESAWMSCGAVNQYSDIGRMEQFVRSFADNKHAQALFLFDCIDPLRYRLFACGLIDSYVERPQRGSALRASLRTAVHWLRALHSLVGLSGRRPCQSLAQMGYGFRAQFWLDLARRLGLKVTIVSSLYFEYRYHVLLGK